MDFDEGFRTPTQNLILMQPGRWQDCPMLFSASHHVLELDIVATL